MSSFILFCSADSVVVWCVHGVEATYGHLQETPGPQLDLWRRPARTGPETQSYPQGLAVGQLAPDSEFSSKS